jgi:hypothetical protein
VEIDLLNHVRNIWTSECQVLQSTDQATIMSGVADRIAGVARNI